MRIPCCPCVACWPLLCVQSPCSRSKYLQPHYLQAERFDPTPEVRGPDQHAIGRGASSPATSRIGSPACAGAARDRQQLTRHHRRRRSFAHTGCSLGLSRCHLDFIRAVLNPVAEAVRPAVDRLRVAHPGCGVTAGWWLELRSVGRYRKGAGAGHGNPGQPNDSPASILFVLHCGGLVARHQLDRTWQPLGSDCCKHRAVDFRSVAGLEPHGHFAGAAIRPQRIGNRCGPNPLFATHQFAFEHGGATEQIVATAWRKDSVRG